MFVILQVVKIVFLKSRRLSGLGPRRNTFRTKLSNVEQTGWFGPKKCHYEKVNRQITSCLHPVSDGLPSFAWLQHFAVCLRELEQQNHTATHTHTCTGYADCVSQVNGDDLLPRFCSVDCHSRSRQFTKWTPPPTQMCYVCGGGLDSFWLLTIITFWVVLCHLLGVI